MALELMTGTGVDPITAEGAPATPSSRGMSAPSYAKTTSELLDQADSELKDLYHAVEDFCLALGDDVTKRTLKYYFAFRRLKNFACVEVHPQTRNLLVYLKINPDTVELEDGFTRDVRAIGHFGTGDLELRIHSASDFEKARSLIQRSYEAS